MIFPRVIATLAAYNLLKKAGAARIGDDAAEELRVSLEELGEKIAKQAISLAAHAGRKTVKETDVKKAVKDLFTQYS